MRRAHVFQGERFPRRDGDGLRGLAALALPNTCRTRGRMPRWSTLRRHLPRPAGARGGAAAAGGQPRGRSMTTIQVAETLELRQTLARQILVDTLWRQAALLMVLVAAVLWVVQRATRPVRSLSASCRARRATRAHRRARCAARAGSRCWTRSTGDGAPDHLLEHQKRFVRDAPAAHAAGGAQDQVQSACAATSSRRPCRRCATPSSAHPQLANQMLSLAKVEQLRQQATRRWSAGPRSVRAVALDLGALIAERQLDFEDRHRAAPVRAHRVGAARADAQPAAQRHPALPRRRHAGDAAERRRTAR